MRLSASILSNIARMPWYAVWRMVERHFYRGREYTIQVPFGRRVLTPWFQHGHHGDFAQTMKTVQAGGNFMMSPDRAHLLYQLVKRASRLPGDLAECGVFQGGSANLTAHVLSRHAPPETRLHLFDTFEGVPPFAIPSRDYHQPGHYSETSLEGVQHRLRNYGGRCCFHPGVIPDTFQGVADIHHYSLVNVDVDLQPTNLACCEWFWPRLVPGGMMIINDYGMYPYRFSTRTVVDQFFADHHEEPLILPTGQALVIKGHA